MLALAVDFDPGDDVRERARIGCSRTRDTRRRRIGRGCGIAATLPERDDQIAHRRKRPGRPIDFGEQQRERYRGRNVVERCFNKLKQWRGLAMRSDKTARNHHSGQCLAATLHWMQSIIR